MEGVGELLIGLAMFINALLAVASYFKALRNAESIANLEKNTNSIKDALIKVTGEAEHAKGVLQGKQEQGK